MYLVYSRFEVQRLTVRSVNHWVKADSPGGLTDLAADLRYKGRQSAMDTIQDIGQQSVTAGRLPVASGRSRSAANRDNNN
jgi:hypothetical protein